MSNFPDELITELKLNMENLKRDLHSIENPDEIVEDFAEGYEFSAYNNSLKSLGEDSADVEMLASFYRSIEVLQEGHPNLLSAEQSELEQAYITLLESALGFGEMLLGRET